MTKNAKQCAKCLCETTVLFEETIETADGHTSHLICTECGGKSRSHNGHVEEIEEIERGVREHLFASMANVHLRTKHGLVRITKGNFGLVATLCDDKGEAIKDFALVIEARP